LNYKFERGPGHCCTEPLVSHRHHALGRAVIEQVYAILAIRTDVLTALEVSNSTNSSIDRGRLSSSRAG
jgi:hypothetical protein